MAEANKPTQDEIKAKMRAALDKKHAASQGKGEAHAEGSQKLHGVDGPVGPRQFRRKSGG